MEVLQVGIFNPSLLMAWGSDFAFPFLISYYLNLNKII